MFQTINIKPVTVKYRIMTHYTRFLLETHNKQFKFDQFDDSRESLFLLFFFAN